MRTENHPSRPRAACGESQSHGDHVPRIDTASIFREMIAREVRDGTLTPWRRRRIVRYAAGLRLSAREAGRLIEECRRTVDPTINECSTVDFHITAPQRKTGLSRVSIFCVALGGVVVVQWIIGWLFG